MTTRTRHLIKEEEAVSPVIGVILMVAITVILAAVIGAFVFGMGGSLKKTYIVAATASQSGSDDIVVTYNGGPDAPEVDYIHVTSAGATTTALPYEMVNTTAGDTVGSSYLFDGASTGRTDHVVVTATFKDGSTQVILDAYV